MNHVFIYCTLSDHRNVGSIIRNVVDYKQIFSGQYSNDFQKEAFRCTMFKRFPNAPRFYEYNEKTVQELIEEYEQNGYDVVVVETDWWNASTPRVKIADITKNTVFIFGNEKSGVPDDLQIKNPKVISLGKHSKTVSVTASNLQVLLQRDSF